jgi:hypothetical protein
VRPTAGPAFLGFEFFKCLMNTAMGLVVHAPALMQHAINRGLAYAGLGCDLLDGKTSGAVEHVNPLKPLAEVLLRSIRGLMRLAQC